LEARYYNDVFPVKLRLDPFGVDALKTRVLMAACGDYARQGAV
jgi:hypothetical protein